MPLGLIKIIINAIRNRSINTESRYWPLLATFIDYLRFHIFVKKKFYNKPQYPKIDPKIKYQLQRDGICIVENYWTESDCARARLEVDRILTENKEYIHSDSKSDFRIYGAENLSKEIAQFNNDQLLANIASDYCEELSAVAFTLAGKLPSSSYNRGSGEGWHRDGFFCQFKAIIYLSDVENCNGPFQFIKNSHKFFWVLRDMWSGKLKYMQYRIDENEINSIVRNKPSRLQTFTAKAGTLILVDTSSIHRGMPISAGIRYALTNYYYAERIIVKELYEQFAPIAGVIDKNKNFIS